MGTLIRQKVLRRFYEPLLLLDALGEVRGQRIKPEAVEDTTYTNITKHRRSFADGIAYICSYQRGPDWVTAVALERLPGTIRVWLTANEDIKSEVFEFLEGILLQIQSVSELEGEASRRTACEQNLDQATTDVLAFNTPRLLSYFKLISSKFVKPCLEIMQIEHETNGTTSLQLAML